MFPAMDVSLTPPNPPSSEDTLRWGESRRRRRLLDGTWAEDFRTRRREHLGTTRDDATGPTSLVLNPMRNICSELSRLYDEAPEVYHAQLAAVDTARLEQAYREAGLVGAITDQAALRRAVIHADLLARGELPLAGFQTRLAATNLWAQMPRFQESVLGCREYLLVPEVSDEGALAFRECYPDRVVAWAQADRPWEPALLAEIRLRTVEGRQIWAWDVYDCTDPARPSFTVRQAKEAAFDGPDITERALGYRPDYPWRRADGSPFIRHELYHASRLGDRLWDPYRWIELAEGTLDFAVLYAFVVHVFRDASWPQRYVANLRVAGADGDGSAESARGSVITDPSTVVQLETPPDTETQGQPMVGQWQAGGDAAALDAVLGGMIQRLAADVGVSLSDVQRVSDASRSGVAISLTSQGKREAQRRFKPHFKPSDEALVGKVAALLNRAGGQPALPETGWEVRYRELPQSPDEIRGRREHVLALLDRGLMGPADAYAELHGVSRHAAEVALARIRLERAALTTQM